MQLRAFFLCERAEFRGGPIDITGAGVVGVKGAPPETRNLHLFCWLSFSAAEDWRTTSRIEFLLIGPDGERLAQFGGDETFLASGPEDNPAWIVPLRIDFSRYGRHVVQGLLGGRVFAEYPLDVVRPQPGEQGA